MWKGELVRESTKQSNDKVARQIEAAHRTRLAKENDERSSKSKQLGCSSVDLVRCPECEKWHEERHASLASDGTALQGCMRHGLESEKSQYANVSSLL
jgi:hypothetical protein